MSDKGRRRVSRDEVRRNAVKGSSGGSNWFNLPDGVENWSPEKADRYEINIVPYEVSVKNHPDDIEKGMLWYKMPFSVHRNIGPRNESLVCPTTVGQKCPICEERERLFKADKKGNAEAIKALNAQRFVAYNILNPQDEDKVCVFSFSVGKFAAFLEKELQDDANEEHRLFFDTNKDGRTLKVRFADASFESHKYLEATRIDFKEREPLDEDKILEAVVQLDTMFNITPYEKLKSMFLQTEQEDEEDEPSKPASKPAEKDDKDEEDEEDEEPKKPAKSEEKKSDEDEDEDEEEEAKTKSKKDEDDSSTCPQCKEEFDTEDGVKSDSLKKLFCCRKCLRMAEEKAADKKDDDKDDKPAKKDDEKPTKSKGEDKECPHEGGKFGKDVDKHKECEDCPHWNACEEANDKKD